MSKKYFIFPFLALLVFGGFYWNFQSTYSEKQAAAEAAAKEEQRVRREKEIEAQNRAIEEAIKIQTARRAEQEAKRKKKEADDKARREAVDLRDRTYREQNQLNNRLSQLKRDLEIENLTLARIRESEIALSGDKTALETYIVKSKANQQRLTDLLVKIEEAARAKAAAEAAAAKKK